MLKRKFRENRPFRTDQMPGRKFAVHREGLYNCFATGLVLSVPVTSYDTIVAYKDHFSRRELTEAVILAA